MRAVAGDLKRFVPQVVLDMIPMGERDARTVMDTLRGVARRVVAVSSQDFIAPMAGSLRLSAIFIVHSAPPGSVD